MTDTPPQVPSAMIRVNWMQQGAAEDLGALIKSQVIDLPSTSAPAKFSQPQDDRGQRCQLTIQLRQHVHAIHVNSNARSCELHAVAPNGDETYCASTTGTNCGSFYALCIQVPVNSWALDTATRFLTAKHRYDLAHCALTALMWRSPWVTVSAGRSEDSEALHVLSKAEA